MLAKLKIISLIIFFIGSVCGAGYYSYQYGLREVVAKEKQVAQLDDEVLALIQRSSKCEKQIEQLSNQSTSVAKIIEQVTSENTELKKQLDVASNRVLVLEQQAGIRDEQKALTKKYAKLVPQEYKGVEFSVRECVKESSRVDCSVILKAIDGDTKISIRTESLIYDNLGNSKNMLSYTSSAGVVHDADRCYQTFDLIEGVNTPYIFSFKSPSNDMIGVSALKLEFATSCYGGSDKVLTFKNIAFR
ncbi:hypothetical protein VST7929_02760 [Vibrio stylophorae]|uniref:Uncharacterized protein n=1 Tax=Vibrio stylophorae TaxID=659351 RepID=A0ABM8ZWS2_9VIBR|nr:hypothetical protein [Vibrio stylophorae]CAH0535099.1 hypothetical protein VST7929_02760 [Vibrio stylophorae]